MNKLENITQEAWLDATLSRLRNLYIDRLNNPAKYADLKTVLKVEYDEITFPYLTFAEIANIECIGSGCYSDVYDIGNGFALKICSRKDCNGIDKGYSGFIRFLSNLNTSHSIFPKIYRKERWENADVFVIEKLCEHTEENLNKRIKYYRIFRDFIKYNKDHYDLTKEQKKVLKRLAKYRVNHNHWLDLHDENVMLRENGDIVITDPFSG